jgi:hypothetical protein
VSLSQPWIVRIETKPDANVELRHILDFAAVQHGPSFQGPATQKSTRHGWGGFEPWSLNINTRQYDWRRCFEALSKTDIKNKILITCVNVVRQ